MKRLPISFSIWYLLTCFSFYSCHDTQTEIKGCCDDPPVSVQVGTGWVWVPNVFTPNGDGLHDFMKIYSDSIKQIVYMEIRSEDHLLVFTRSHFLGNTPGDSWDGSYKGKRVRGLYTYTMLVEAADGYAKTITGHICNCPCDQAGDEDFTPVSNCEFGLCDPHFIDCDEREFLPCFKY